jgi:hypothetical protein
MSLSDAMGAAGLGGFAQVGLAISFATFVAILAGVLLRPRAEMDARARSVLDDGGPAGGLGGSERRG